MSTLNLPPTRSNLLLLQERLAFAVEGYQILDKKREVLSSSLLAVVQEAQQLQKEVWALLESAYRKLEFARLTMGEEKVEWAAMAVTNLFEVEIITRGTMGVPLPQIEMTAAIPDLTYSLGDTSVELDDAMAAFQGVMKSLPRLTEIETKVYRLAKELKKTQRRVHALERIFIPEYKELIEFIENTLEEQDREEVFRLKWLKTKKEKHRK